MLIECTCGRQVEQDSTGTSVCRRSDGGCGAIMQDFSFETTPCYKTKQEYVWDPDQRKVVPRLPGWPR